MKFKNLYFSIALFSLFLSACNSNKEGNEGTKSEPLNLSIFVDLSDRIQKVSKTDGILQADKDQEIINGIINSFISKQQKEGFQKSEDSFQIVYYPSPEGTHSLVDSLALDLYKINGPKKKPLIQFRDNHNVYLKQLYDSALIARQYFGSDIWGFFAKDKVSDLYKTGYRNVLVILSDGYIFEVNNKIKDGNNYSYILPQTLAVKGSGLIPCTITQTDFEIYFIECKANPQTDYPKMKKILEKWFSDMGIKEENVDIRDTDIPANTLRHLNNKIF